MLPKIFSRSDSAPVYEDQEPQALRADTPVIVSAFQAFGNYTSAIRGLTAPALDVSARPGLNPEIPTCQVPNKM
jgi:hypothetical protein